MLLQAVDAVYQARQVLKDFNFSTSDGFEADARKATDAAIRKAYDVLNALRVLQPSTELTALVNVLFGRGLFISINREFTAPNPSV